MDRRVRRTFKPMVLLIGNYPPDRQESMHRFALMLLDGLAAAGVPAEMITPTPFFGRLGYAGGFVGKWLAYIDKFILFPRQLRSRLKDVRLIHICDHSNAMYAGHAGAVPVVTTCHDLLAVRGALGEQTDCPASVTGKMLQRWILSGLERSNVVCCVSEATLNDARRLVKIREGKPRLEFISLGLNYPYQQISLVEARRRLAGYPALASGEPFVLHVGSNLKRKNRQGVLRIFARCQSRWNGLLVFAGEPLSQPLRDLALQLGILDRVIEVPHATSELLEALYNCATAMLFPSSFEGFGWPIVEANACGCPVISTNRQPMSEVTGNGGMSRAIEDEAGLAADLLSLTNPVERENWSAKALENALRFSAAEMIAKYRALYRTLALI